MKNLITALTLLLTIGSANAFWNNNSWDNQDSNYEDNGIFAYNKYDFWDPRWYSTEFTNMVNEMDDELEITDHAVTAGSPYNFPVK
jgi:aspartate/tyrosine/aromatic aminotransferase